jgi:hypothetical protein
LEELEKISSANQGTRMVRYEQVQQAALSRLSPADRNLWREWAALWSERGDAGLTDAHRTVWKLWEETFYQVAAEMPGPPKITAYDQWV